MGPHEKKVLHVAARGSRGDASEGARCGREVRGPHTVHMSSAVVIIILSYFFVQHTKLLTNIEQFNFKHIFY